MWARGVRSQAPLNVECAGTRSARPMLPSRPLAGSRSQGPVEQASLWVVPSPLYAACRLPVHEHHKNACGAPSTDAGAELILALLGPALPAGSQDIDGWFRVSCVPLCRSFCGA